ncbi:MAG: radical SAM protein [Dehalococcoidia bacterium]
MLNITRLLCGVPTPGDDLRYGERKTDGTRAEPVHAKPVVVWNITRRCNLRCVHCYSSSVDSLYPGELSTTQAKSVLEDLSCFGIPVVLFSGGEPTTRLDLPDLVQYAAQLGLRPVLSTNGTLLTSDLVGCLYEAGLRRIGISLDGLGPTNDAFRGKDGAFEAALSGIRESIRGGMRLSLRVTLTTRTVRSLPGLFDLAEQEGIPRFCIYHLAYAGRGRKLLPFDLSHEDRRRTVEYIFDRTLQSASNGIGLEVLTVDNHADGAHLLMWSARHAPDRVGPALRLLRRNGGNTAGKGIACIDNVGDVHPDQFWWTQTVGNVLERPFSEIWTDPDIDLLAKLRDRKAFLPKRCSECRWLDICNGNLRVRAESATRDLWSSDPACYLTEGEIRV